MAAQSGLFWDISHVCATSASLLTKQFYGVALSSATTPDGWAPIIIGSTGIGTSAFYGVLQDTPDVGRAGTVRKLGVTKMVASSSGSILQGGPITLNASGQAMNADTTGMLVIGRSLQGLTASASSGTLIAVALSGPYIYG